MKWLRERGGERGSQLHMLELRKEEGVGRGGEGNEMVEREAAMVFHVLVS